MMPRPGWLLVICLILVGGWATSAYADDLLSERVARHYVRLAQVRYQESLQASQQLLVEIESFLKNPSEESHKRVKRQWLKAHSTYSHTEVFRFGNPNVDDWEGKVNAWPLDEGLIDYVAEDYVFHEGNPFARHNIVGAGRFPITDDMIAKLQSGADMKEAPDNAISDVETNVATGFHAIEFLLWGQDLNQNPADAGQRPFSDFVMGDGGTNGQCGRRRDFLSAAGRLLVADMRIIVADWDPSQNLYATSFLELPTEQRLDRMILGLGGLSYAELASERLRVALIAQDQEEEQSCFSDQTHWSIFHNAVSIESTYLGQHQLASGEVVQGPALADLVQAIDPELDERLRQQLKTSVRAARVIVDAAESGVPFDQMILEANPKERAKIETLIAALRAQTETIEKIRAKTNALAQD